VIKDYSSMTGNISISAAVPFAECIDRRGTVCLFEPTVSSPWHLRHLRARPFMLKTSHHRYVTRTLYVVPSTHTTISHSIRAQYDCTDYVHTHRRWPLKFLATRRRGTPSIVTNMSGQHSSDIAVSTFSVIIIPAPVSKLLLQMRR